ncbi:MAG: hypothetical protein K2X27_26175, partial [Candidatus Obscuribacterales bacterium]|nr:hypothetical protein [Candidatus Obscuribacterales bacterium]
MKFKSAFFGIFAAALALTLGGCNWDDPKPAPSTPDASGYEITVLNDSKVVVDADSYTYTDPDKVDYHLTKKDASGNESGSATGTWTVKHRAWKSQATEKRYEATLYNGKEAVGSWQVRTFQEDGHSVLLFPADGGEVMRVSGTIVVKELKAVTVAPATGRVTLSNGAKVELSNYSVIGSHLEGQAADGSGYVFI